MLSLFLRIGPVFPAVVVAACSPSATQRQDAPPAPVPSRSSTEAPVCLAKPRGPEPASAATSVVESRPVAAPPVVVGRCFLKTPGVYGRCMNADACSSLAGHVSTPGLCGGGPDVACCTEEPHLEANPPPGWLSVPQARVTSEMTAWALAIVGAPTACPMGSTMTQRFGDRQVMARVEWHPPSQTLGTMHRGVSLYEPL